MNRHQDIQMIYGERRGLLLRNGSRSVAKGNQGRIRA